MMEDAFGQHELLTYQSHQCTVHVPQQLSECGPGAFATEAYVERAMGGFKKLTARRTFKNPELTAVKHMQFGQALSQLQVRQPQAIALYNDALARTLSTSIRATKKRQQREELKDSVEQADYLVGVMQEITEDYAKVCSQIVRMTCGR